MRTIPSTLSRPEIRRTNNKVDQKPDTTHAEHVVIFALHRLKLHKQKYRNVCKVPRSERGSWPRRGT